MTSPSSGYFPLGETPGFRALSCSPGYHVMVSFRKNVTFPKCRGPSLHWTSQEGKREQVWSSCSQDYAASLVTNCTALELQVDYAICLYPNCSRVLLSLHPESQSPQQLTTGLFNCSSGSYSAFQQHLHCNLRKECEDGRDETEECAFSDANCRGMVALCGRCYNFVDSFRLEDFESAEKNSVQRAKDYCSSSGGRLGIPTCLLTMYEGLQTYIDQYRFSFDYTYAGLYYGGFSLPNMYRKSVFNEDKAVLHHLVTICYNSWNNQKASACLLLVRLQFGLVDCRGERGTLWSQASEYWPTLVCEFNVSQRQPQPPVQLPAASQGLVPPEHFTRCQDGRLMFAFLSCSAEGETCHPHPNHLCSFSFTTGAGEAGCGDSHCNNYNKPVPTFTCDDEGVSLPLTLVCDFLADCRDGADESFCHHLPCSNGFACGNGQCVPYSQRCDVISNCHDGSDERDCPNRLASFTSQALPSPVLIDFDGVSAFTCEEMAVNDSCPESHYRCPGELGDCLPVYTRCNGLHDCADHGDEAGCEGPVCPGLYRCRQSPVCLLKDHLCDGWPHCPLGDDELLCDMACPVVCQCAAHTFLCVQPFLARLFPQLRYVDASGSQMTSSSFSHNVMLMYLILVRCSLVSVPPLRLLNLLVLDLSGNELRSVNMTVFASLPNLKALSLARNPLHKLHIDLSRVTKQRALETVDLSHTGLLVFDSKVFSSFTSLKVLNLSFTTIHTISSHGFVSTPQLAELYIDGSPTQKLPIGLFDSCPFIDYISAPNYKFCCSEMLTAMSCFAPRELSSCQDLFRPVSYRGVLWLTGCLSITGNSVCVVTSLLTGRMTSLPLACSVFAVNLMLADLLMGVSLVVTAAADQMYRGVYVLYADAWTRGILCKLVGVHSLVSCEVSSFTLCLLTVDRCIQHRFTTSKTRFSKTSAIMASLLAWTVGFCFALLFLIPKSARWQLYGHTGICIPLPFTRSGLDERICSISVLLSLNFFLCLMVSIGQALAYWSLQKDALVNDTKYLDTDLSRQRLTVSVLHVLCWFCVGLCWALAQRGGSYVFEGSNVVFALLTFAFNSVLNPSVCILSILAERGRTLRGEPVEQWLHSLSALPESSSSAG